jgi:prepilin-type N-terminal cleavage/methylation domain-containing protein
MRTREAFTLIEMMIVVVIVAGIAALVGPTLATAMRDRKHAAAALDVVRAFQGARASAAGYGRAYAVRYEASGADGQGTLTVRRGDNNRCNGSTDWSSLPAVTGLGYTPAALGTSEGFELLLAVEGGGAFLELCYEPTGTTTWRTEDEGRFATAAPAADASKGGFGFTVTRELDGQVEGVTRRVVAPFGADARIAR